MKSTPLVEKFKKLNLISPPGEALDLGCGAGEDAVALAEMGFNVTAVDRNTEEISNRKGSLPISVITSDIMDFNIENGKYNIIIANNVLSFLDSKDKVYEIIKAISSGLLHGGIMYITIFGPKDAWAKEDKKMTFISYDEATAFLESLGLTSIHRLTEEGLGPVRPAGIKYWHIHRFLYKKP